MLSNGFHQVWVTRRLPKPGSNGPENNLITLLDPLGE